MLILILIKNIKSSQKYLVKMSFINFYFGHPLILIVRKMTVNLTFDH